MAEWITIAKVAEVPPGKRRIVDLDGVGVAVFNLDGEFFAIEDVCTHDGGLLANGKLEGDEIICPRHGARFCIRTGEALTAPAFEPTAVFPVRIDSGNIQVRDDRWD